MAARVSSDLCIDIDKLLIFNANSRTRGLKSIPVFGVIAVTARASEKIFSLKSHEFNSLSDSILSK